MPNWENEQSIEEFLNKFSAANPAPGLVGTDPSTGQPAIGASTTPLLSSVVVGGSVGTYPVPPIVSPTGTGNSGKQQSRDYYTPDDFRAAIDADDANGLELAGAACISSGRTLMISRPLNIGTSIVWGDASGATVATLNIRASPGCPVNWTGSSNATVIQTWGLYNSHWEGLSVPPPSGKTNLALVNHDAAGAQFVSNNTMSHCDFEWGNGQTGITCIVLGLTTAVPSDISGWRFSGCKFDDHTTTATFAATLGAGQTSGTSFQVSSTVQISNGDVLCLSANTVTRREFLTVASVVDSTHVTFTATTAKAHNSADTINRSPCSNNVGIAFGGDNTLTNKIDSCGMFNLTRAITNNTTSLLGGAQSGLLEWTIDGPNHHGNWIDIDVGPGSGIMGVVTVTGGRIENTGHRISNANLGSTSTAGVSVSFKGTAFGAPITDDGYWFTLYAAGSMTLDDCRTIWLGALLTAPIFQLSCAATSAGSLTVRNCHLPVASTTPKFWTIGTGLWNVVPQSNLTVSTTGSTQQGLPGVLPWPQGGTITLVPTTVASGSNGAILANIATWGTPGPGQLSIVSTAGWTSGYASVVTSGGTALIAYTTTGGGVLSGITYIGTTSVTGSTDTISTGAAVTPATLIPPTAVNVATTSVGSGGSGGGGGTAASAAAMPGGGGGASGSDVSLVTAVGSDTYLIHTVGAGGAAVSGHAAGSAGAGSVGLPGNASSVTGWPSLTTYVSAPGGGPGGNGSSGTIPGGVKGGANFTTPTGTQTAPHPGDGGYTSAARGEWGGAPGPKVGGGGAGGGPSNTTVNGGTGGPGGSSTTGGTGTTTLGGSGTINGTNGTQGTDGTGGGGGGGGAGAFNGSLAAAGSGGNSGRGGNGRTEWLAV